MQKDLPIIGEIGEVRRIMRTDLIAEEKVLCLLYEKDGQSSQKLLNSIEYTNKTNFHDILKSMHKKDT